MPAILTNHCNEVMSVPCSQRNVKLLALCILINSEVQEHSLILLGAHFKYQGMQLDPVPDI